MLGSGMQAMKENNIKLKIYDLNNKHFESSQKLQKDGIGILENFIKNMLSNYILTLYLITVVLCFVLVNCTC